MAIYNGKHCVFEEVGLDADALVWNADTNVDNDSAYNNWNISDIRKTALPARVLKLSSDLQSVLINTTVQTATNGNNGTLISTSDKLFLAAAKEISSSPSYAVSQENSALTTRSYWTTHNSQSDRIKYNPSNVASNYWLRSPHSGDASCALYIHNNGVFSYFGANYERRVSPCFAF